MPQSSLFPAHDNEQWATCDGSRGWIERAIGESEYPCREQKNWGDGGRRLQQKLGIKVHP